MKIYFLLVAIIVTSCGVHGVRIIAETDSVAIVPVLTKISGNEAVKTLGWDPQYTLYTDTLSVVHGDECTIYCHGVGQNQEFISVLQKRRLLVGNIIGFDFEDAVYKGTFQLSKSGFGQEHDTKALLYLLKYLDEVGIPRFHLYGYSRGGAVIMNAVKQLVRYKEHRAIFRKLRISHIQAQRLLKKIQAGTLVLDCPLVDMRVITKYRFPKICGFLDCVVLPMGTHGKYVPWKDQAIKSASYCKSLDLALLVHFQNRDTIVTNICDDLFYEKIQGPRTIRVQGIDGSGHFHRGEELAPALIEFHEKYGGPHLKRA